MGRVGWGGVGGVGRGGVGWGGVGSVQDQVLTYGVSQRRMVCCRRVPNLISKYCFPSWDLSILVETIVL